MSDIGKGDFVECVLGHEDVLKERHIYVVEEVISMADYLCGLHEDKCSCFGVRTVDPPLPPDMWWCGARFRPIPFLGKQAPLEEAFDICDDAPVGVPRRVEA